MYFSFISYLLSYINKKTKGHHVAHVGVVPNRLCILSTNISFNNTFIQQSHVTNGLRIKKCRRFVCWQIVMNIKTPYK